MVFVRRVPGRSGSTKVQLAERRAGRDVVVEHVGTARSEAELAVLMAEARRRLRPGQQSLDLGVVNDGLELTPWGRTGTDPCGLGSAYFWRSLASSSRRARVR